MGQSGERDAARRALLDAARRERLVLLDDRGIVRELVGAEPALGLGPAAWAGRRVVEWLHADDVVGTLEAFTAVRAIEGERRDLRVRVRHADGRWVPIQLGLSGHLGDPVLESVVASIVELGEPAAETALSDVLPVGLIVGGPRGASVYANDVAREWLGWDDGELRVAHWTGRAEVDDALAGAVGEAIGGAEPADLEFEVQGRFLRGVVRPLLAAAGGHDGWVLLLEDVTATWRARQDRDRLAELVALAGDAVISVDESGRIATWNRAAEHLFGYGAAEAVGAVPADLLTPASGDARVGDAMRRALDGERLVVEGPRRRKDGEIVWVSTSLTPELDADGRVTGIIIISRDQTARHEAEQQRTQLRADLRALFEAGTAGLAIVEADQGIVEVNGAFAALVGRARDDLIGRSLFELVHPDDVDPELVEAVASGAVSSPATDRRLRQPNGGHVPARIGVTPVDQTATGHVRSAVVAVDVSATARIAEEYERLFDESPVPLSLVDGAHRMVRVNRSFCELTDRRASEVLGRRPRDFVVPEDLPAPEVLDSWLVTGADLVLEGRLLRPDGTTRDVRVRGVTVDEAAATRRVLVQWTDVTEQRRAERDRERLVEALRSANQRLEVFAAECAHELRKPLTTVQGLARVLGREKLELEAEATVIERIEGNAREALDHIDDLLAGARIATPESGVRVALNDVVDLVQAELSWTLDATGGRIEVGELPTVVADPDAVAAVFRTLVANAVKYRRPDRTPIVRLSAAIDPDRPLARIRVEDNGPGIDRESRSRVFRPGYRAPGSEHVAGSGLGLAECQDRVARWGGTIRVVDAALGGAGFEITIPVPRHVAAGPTIDLTDAAPAWPPSDIEPGA